MLNTLGDVVTCVLGVAGVILIPAAIVRAWWPELRAQLGALFIMSCEPEGGVRPANTDAVHVLVPGTDTDANITAEVDSISDEYEMPRVGRRLSDPEIVALLATQKGVDGTRYRFSANQIFELVKGSRAEVLAQIKAIREGPVAPQVREYQAKLAQLQAAPNES